MIDKDSASLHSDLVRVANSFVMVYNPTPRDYVVKYSMAGIHYYGGGGSTGEPPRRFVIPGKDRDQGYGKGKKEVPFFIAEKYYKEMSDKLIYETSDAEMRKQRNKWKRDPGEFAEWWGQNANKFVNKSNLKDKYYKELILGKTREFGDRIEEVEEQEEKETIISKFESLGEYKPEEKVTISQNRKDFVKSVSK